MLVWYSQILMSVHSPLRFKNFKNKLLSFQVQSMTEVGSSRSNIVNAPFTVVTFWDQTVGKI